MAYSQTMHLAAINDPASLVILFLFMFVPAVNIPTGLILGGVLGDKLYGEWGAIVGAVIGALVGLWIIVIYARRTKEAQRLRRERQPADLAELERLYAEYPVAAERAIAAVKDGTPLEGEGLQRFLDEDAKVTAIVKRIKELKNAQRPQR